MMQRYTRDLHISRRRRRIFCPTPRALYHTIQPPARVLYTGKQIFEPNTCTLLLWCGVDPLDHRWHGNLIEQATLLTNVSKVCIC